MRLLAELPLFLDAHGGLFATWLAISAGAQRIFAFQRA
jgi:hypothetical protein